MELLLIISSLFITSQVHNTAFIQASLTAKSPWLIQIVFFWPACHSVDSSQQFDL